MGLDGMLSCGPCDVCKEELSLPQIGEGICLSLDYSFSISQKAGSEEVDVQVWGGLISLKNVQSWDVKEDM